MNDQKNILAKMKWVHKLVFEQEHIFVDWLD
jgi:hypothetical protein